MNTLFSPIAPSFVSFGASKRKRSLSHGSDTSTSCSDTSSGGSDYAALERKKIDNLKQNWRPLALYRAAQKSMLGAKNRGKSPVREMDDFGNPKEPAESFQQRMLNYYETNSSGIGVQRARSKFLRQQKRKKMLSKKARREQTTGTIDSSKEAKTPVSAPPIPTTSQAPMAVALNRAALTSSPVHENNLRSASDLQTTQPTPTSTTALSSHPTFDFHTAQQAYPTPQNSIGPNSLSTEDIMLSLMYGNPNVTSNGTFDHRLVDANYNWIENTGGIASNAFADQTRQFQDVVPPQNLELTPPMSRKSSTLSLNKQYRLRDSAEPALINTFANPPQIIPIDQDQSRALATARNRRVEFSEFKNTFLQLRAKFKSVGLNFDALMDSKALGKTATQPKCTTMYSIHGRRYPTL